MEKRDFKKLLKDNLMTMKEFSELYSIPYVSVRNLSRETKKKAKQIFKLK